MSARASESTGTPCQKSPAVAAPETSAAEPTGQAHDGPKATRDDA
jgi:hypothetical protein